MPVHHHALHARCARVPAVPHAAVPGMDTGSGLFATAGGDDYNDATLESQAAFQEKKAKDAEIEAEAEKKAEEEAKKAAALRETQRASDARDDKVAQVMLGGRLYDARTLNEVATGNARRGPYFWETSAN